MKLPIYLINLDGSNDRLASARAQLDAAGVAFERVPAFDGRGRAIEDFPDVDPAAAMAYMGRPLRGGEIGCYLSHLACVERFLASEQDHCVVLEDDLQLRPGAFPLIEQMIAGLLRRSTRWDVVNIGADRLKYASPLFALDASGAQAHVLRGHYFPMTTTGLVWTRQGAERFVKNCRPIFAPVDNFLREWQCVDDRGLAVSPPLVTTTGASSDIDGGAKARKSEGRSIFYGWRKQKRVLRNKLRALRHKRAQRG